jgi:RNA polymerase sigma-70 factor (ECF subfamily)
MNVAQRDPTEAFEVVVRQHLGGLARLADALLPMHLRGTLDAHDVVQDVLARTARRLDAIVCDDDVSLLKYVRRAIRHRIIDELRRSARRPQVTGDLERWPAPGRSPLDAAIQAQNGRRLRAALRGLKPRQRQAVILRVGSRLSYEEIAARLDIPSPNAARVAVRRAVDRLAQLVDHPARLPPC